MKNPLPRKKKKGGRRRGMQQSRGGSHPEYVEGIWQKETKDSTPTGWKAAYELAARGEPSLVFIS